MYFVILFLSSNKYIYIYIYFFNLPLFFVFKAKYQASFIYRGMAIWNRLPSNIRDTDSVKSFRKVL